MTIRLANEISIPKILQTAKEFGIDEFLDDNMSMSFDGLVKLIDITNAYGIIANGGKKYNQTLYKVFMIEREN